MTDKPTVLIVDDESTNIQLLAACLKQKYVIKVATSGQQCLDLIQNQFIPDLILLDIEMPNMDGYTVCRSLKSYSKTELTPIIFVTGKDGDADEEKGLQLGAVDYITKPVRPAIVLARVDTHVTLKQQRDKLKTMALRDQLTDLYNRFYLLEEAHHKIAFAKRHKHELSLLMMDIDYFKLINDQHGHLIGDEVLKAVAKLLMEVTRTEDIVARFGGEEFVVVLDHTEADGAKLKAENIRRAIEELTPENILVTVSIGLAQYSSGKETFEELLKRADIAVYQAKEQGRNRVIIAEDNEETSERKLLADAIDKP